MFEFILVFLGSYKVEEMAGVREITAGKFINVCVLPYTCLVTKKL